MLESSFSSNSQTFPDVSPRENSAGCRLTRAHLDSIERSFAQSPSEILNEDPSAVGQHFGKTGNPSGAKGLCFLDCRLDSFADPRSVEEFHESFAISIFCLAIDLSDEDICFRVKHGGGNADLPRV